MTSLCCPLCSLSLSAASLEAHLRQELAYPSTACQLCLLRFTDDRDAADHFAGPLARHPGQPPLLIRLQREADREARLLELVRLARGGREAVEERLCVCGHCRLLCREQGGGAEQSESAPRLGLHVAPKEAAERVPKAPPASEPKERPFAPPHRRSGQAYQPPAAEESQPQEAEEPQAPLDVKPSLAELRELKDVKPQLSSDGKVACLLCGLRVGKEEFKRHAHASHSEARPYSCNLCAHWTKTKSELVKHQRKEHQTATTPDSFTFLGSAGEETELLERCFGAAKDVDYARLRCKPCDKLFKRSNTLKHVAVEHLKKPLYACRLCDYQTIRQDQAKNHVKKSHKREAGEETLDSSQAQHYAPILKGMVAQLFQKN